MRASRPGSSERAMLTTSSARPRVAVLGVPGTARTSAGASSGATAGSGRRCRPGWRGRGIRTGRADAGPVGRDAYGAVQRVARGGNGARVRQEPRQLLVHGVEERGADLEQAAGEGDFARSGRWADGGSGVGDVACRVTQDGPGDRVVRG